MTRPNDDMLDALFARAQQAEVAPSDDLMARVLADADAVQDGLAHSATAVEPTAGFWTRMADAIGGWPSLGGLAAATVAGIWIGVAPPAALADVTASLLGDAVTVPMVPTDLGVFADG